MTSPTQRTLAKLRKEGYYAAICEKWNVFARRRIDLFGGDILAIKEGEGGPLLIQCTTAANQSHRLKKTISLSSVKTWLLCGGRFEVWGWSKKGKRGKRKLWSVSIRVVTLEDFGDVGKPPLD